MPNLDFDLTGGDPAFKVVDRPYMWFTPNQVLEFSTPVYADSIQVFLKRSDESIVQLAINTDWTTGGTTYLDNDGMSFALLKDATFSKKLIHAISITKQYTANQVLLVNYQMLYLDRVKQASTWEEPSGPNCTPALLKELATDVSFLMNTHNPFNDVITGDLANLKVMDEDRGTVVDGVVTLNPANWVENEIHHINTPANYNIIRLAAGAYYDVDVAISVVDGASLVKGKDWWPIGPNLAKTKISNHTAGVYDYILVGSAVAGAVSVSYHAFGGNVSLMDFYALRDALLNINEFLQSGTFITKDNIGDTMVVTDMSRRLSVMEDYLRHWPVATMVADTADVAGSHWYNIAFVYKDAWFTSLNVTETYGQLRVAFTNKNIVYDVRLRFSLYENGMELTGYSVACVDNDLYTDFTDYLNYEPPRGLKFRLVWIDDTNKDAGMVLQIGYDIATDGETIMVSDRTGHDSNITLYPGNGEKRLPADYQTTLPSGKNWYYIWQVPNGSTIADLSNIPAGVTYARTADGLTLFQKSNIGWGVVDTSNADLIRYDEWCELVISPNTGYLLWAGNMPVTTFTPSSSGAGGITITSEAKYDLRFVKRVLFSFFDKRTGKFISSQYERSDDDPVVSGGEFFYEEDLCSLQFELSANSSGNIVIKLEATMGTNSIQNDRFDLRQIVLFNNIQ